MRTLATQTLSGLDISTITEVASLSIDSDALVTVRLALSDIQGNTSYTIALYINGVPLLPSPDIPVIGATSCGFQSRGVWVVAGDVISAKVRGAAGDVSVSTQAIISDMSPVTADDLAPGLADTVVGAVAGMEISVRPETQILGPCSTPTTNGMSVLPERLVTAPVPIPERPVRMPNVLSG
jgi:hypothetical protein